MFRTLLGFLALAQIILGIVLLSKSAGFASISFDSQTASHWLNENSATSYYGPSQPASQVSVGTITINRESH